MTDLSGKTALITGGTDGIGKGAALRMAALGARVILVGRSAEKGERALSDIRTAHPAAQVEFWPYDLALMKEVARLAEQIRERVPHLDYLIHSAGVMLPRRTMTAEGLETVFAVQYLARFSLTRSVLDCLKDGGRVLSVSAGGTIPIRLDFGNLNGERFYNGVYALIHESVANDLFGLRFVRLHPDIRYYNYGPFYVKSGLFTQMGLAFKLATATVGRLMATTPEAAARDIAVLITSDRPSGMYSRNLKPVAPNAYRADPAVQDRLWAESERLVAMALGRVSA